MIDIITKIIQRRVEKKVKTKQKSHFQILPKQKNGKLKKRHTSNKKNDTIVKQTKLNEQKKQQQTEAITIEVLKQQVMLIFCSIHACLQICYPFVSRSNSSGIVHLIIITYKITFIPIQYHCNFTHASQQDIKIKLKLNDTEYSIY